MKKGTGKNIIIILLVLIIIALLARYVIFAQQFEERGQGLQNIQTWQDNYRATHPNATDEEVDAAFEKSINDLKTWKENYKKDHPGATDEDAEKAFSDAWSGAQQ